MDRWFELTLVVSGATASLYIDGVLVGGPSAVATAFVASAELGVGSMVGGWPAGEDTYTSNTRMWAFALSAAEVASLHYDDLQPATAPVIDARWAEQAGVTSTNLGSAGGVFTFSGSPSWASAVPGCVVRRARRNYAPYSNAPTNANWTLNSGLASVTADGGVPHPTRTSGVVYRATENTANSGHTARFYPGGSSTFGNSLAGLEVRFSAKVKKGVGRDYVYFALNSSAIGVWFELATGVFSNATAGIRYGAKSLGSGWFEVWIAGISALAGSGVAALWMANVSGNVSYLGDGSYFYLCDPTLQPIEYAPNYVETTTAGAAYFGEEGSPQEENLFKYSEDTSNAAWTKSGFTTTTGQTDPLGGTTAVALFETATNVQHTITCPQVMTGNRWYCMSAYVKRGPTSRTTFLLAPTNILGLYFDASTLTMQLYNASSLEAAYGYEDAGNGWYRIWVAGYMNVAGAGYINCRVDTCVGGVGTTSAYLGDAAYSALVWGLQMTEGRSLASYVKTVESAINTGAPRGQAPKQNLFTQTEDLTAAAWTRSGLTSVTDLGLVGPGGRRAFRLTDSNASTLHYLEHSSTTSGLVLNRAYTMTLYVRSGTKTKFALGTGAGSTIGFCYIDTSTTQVTGTGVVQLEDAGDGWYRGEVTFSMAAFQNIRLYMISTNGSATYVGDGTGTIDFCAPSITEANGPADYVPAVASVVSSGAPRGRAQIPNYRPLGSDGVFYSAFFNDNSVIPLSTSANSAALISALNKMGITTTRSGALAVAQTSASTFVPSIANNVPRIVNFGTAGGQGYLVEKTSFNILTNSRQISDWAVSGDTSTVTDDYAVSADGSTLVDRQQVSSGNFGRYQNSYVSVSTVRWSLSQWARRGVLGVASSQGLYFTSGAGAAFSGSVSSALTDAWARYDINCSTAIVSGSTLTVSPAEGRTINTITASNRDAVMDFVQMEPVAYPTSPIITAGAAATRNADVSSLNRSLVRGGCLNVEYRFSPLMAIGEEVGALTLYYESANNYLAINLLTGSMQGIIGGVLIYGSSTLMNWTRFDVIDLWFSSAPNRATLCSYRKNGGAEVKLATASGVAPAWPNGTAVEVIGGNGAPISAIYHSVVGRIDGYKPSWVL